MFNQLSLYGFLIALVASTATVELISPSDALDNVGSPDVLFLDVRESFEYETGHIPGSILMPLSSGVLGERWSELPTDSLIIVYCRSGSRSATAAAFLESKGFTQLLNMSGGFTAYTQVPDAQIETGPYQEPSLVNEWMLY